MPIPQILKKLFERRIVVDNRLEPKSMASQLDVDRVHSILDAAEYGDTRDLFSLYRDMIVSDAHVQTEFGKRKLAVCGNPYMATAAKGASKEDIRAAALINEALTKTKGMMRAMINLLDGSLYPLSVMEKVFDVGPLGYRLKGLYHVPYRLLDFTTGKLQIRDTDDAGREVGTLRDPYPERYIVHRGHLLSTPDNWGGPMRSILFWWLLSAMDRDWWARMLERYGTPFMVGKYDPNDDQSRRVLERAFSLSCKLGGIAVSTDTQIEIKQAAASDSGGAYEKFLAICQREKSKAILGQTLSADAQATGMGSGVADAHEAVRGDIRKFDTVMLLSTLEEQLFQQILDINTCPGQMPEITSGSNVDNPEKITATGTTLASLYVAGIELSDEGIQLMSGKLGLPLQRKLMPALTPFSVSRSRPGRRPIAKEKAMDAIALNTSADLAQAFRGELAPIARIIRESKSPEACLAAVEAFVADHSPRRSQEIVEMALTAYAANGAL